VLLEAIFALTLFAATAAVVIGGLNSCIQNVNDLRMKAKAGDLAVTLLSEIQMGLVPPADDGPTDYPVPDEDWCWQIVTAPLDPVPSAPPQTQLKIIITNKVEAYSCSLVFVVTTGGAPTEQEAAVAVAGVGVVQPSGSGGTR